MTERKSILLRLDPAVHEALSRWAADDLRSTTAQIEFLLRQGLAKAGRLPGELGGLPRRGRPRQRRDEDEGGDGGAGSDTPAAGPDGTGGGPEGPGTVEGPGAAEGDATRA